LSSSSQHGKQPTTQSQQQQQQQQRQQQQQQQRRGADSEDHGDGGRAFRAGVLQPLALAVLWPAGDEVVDDMDDEGKREIALLRGILKARIVW
jgi:hypothetical protein